MPRRGRLLRQIGALLSFSLLASLMGCRSSHPFNVSLVHEITLTPHDRLLILAPHPDDEVIGCGGIIQHALAMHVPVQVVFFTYGDNNQWSFLLYRKHPVLVPDAVKRMGLVRHDEALDAARILGILPDRLQFLGYPDFGTLKIWENHWGDQPPLESMLTRTTQVPYANALRPGAPYTGQDILQDLTTILRTVRPTKVFVSHPGDQMPDHRALYLFTMVALWNLEAEMRPEVYPYLVHYKRWPKPLGDHASRRLEPPEAFAAQIPWRQYRLSPVAMERKRAALKAHRSQYNYSASYMLSFVRPNELFGDFPLVTLRENPAASALSPDDAWPLLESPEELTEEERAKFVGLEWRSVQLEGGDVVLSLTFSRPLAQTVNASAYLFGYRSDVSFTQMPKLHVKVSALSYEVYDQNRLLPDQTVRVTRQFNGMTIRVPLQALGQPTRILTSARTYLSEVPLDWVSWRLLELPADH